FFFFLFFFFFFFFFFFSLFFFFFFFFFFFQAEDGIRDTSVTGVQTCALPILIAGLAVANFFPAFAERLTSAIRPELYIKIAIVILGAFIAVTAAGKLNLASSLLLRGIAAIVEAYLIYWPIVYLIARKGFGFSREWSAPLASGIS